MPEWEDNLKSSFGFRQVNVKRFKNNIIKLHNSIEAGTGVKYIPPSKPLKEKILDVLKFADNGSEWSPASIQLHLYFFHKKDFSKNYIGQQLKQLEASGVLEKVGRGLYKKVG